MNNCFRKHHRQRIDPVPIQPSTETELRLLRATVAALQAMGLMDRDALEQARRHTPGELLTGYPCRPIMQQPDDVHNANCVRG